jgi:hypothetical protein
MSRVVNPDGSTPWVKNPQLEQITNPDGSGGYAHVTPPLPGSPPGTPGESTPVLGPDGQPVISKLPPNVQDARNKAYADFTGKDGDDYITAQNSLAWLQQMETSANEMNRNGGWTQTGPTNPARMQMLSMLNDGLRSIGVQPIDTSAVSSWEELKKATTTAGFELSSHFEGHARQAASTIQNATAAVPSSANSPEGFRTVAAGIREMAQQAIDLHEYKQGVYNSGGDLTRSDVDFYKQNPAPAYVRRARSVSNPYKITDDSQMSRYLPGTFVSSKGVTFQVPNRPGAPQMPDYLQGAPDPTGAPQ